MDGWTVNTNIMLLSCDRTRVHFKFEQANYRGLFHMCSNIGYFVYMYLFLPQTGDMCDRLIMYAPAIDNVTICHH